MSDCIFVSDLHGKQDKFTKLIDYVKLNSPKIVFIGGDLLPQANGYYSTTINRHRNFITGYLFELFAELKKNLGEDYPSIFLILGNDDARIDEQYIIEGERLGLWQYVNQKKISLGDYKLFGYSYVPPTPFQLKDWEKYDISRFVDHGCISPEEGRRTVAVGKSSLRYSTIKKDLELMIEDEQLDKSIFLFHAPPHNTNLDRAALDNKKIDHVNVDVHVGSIAIKRFIEKEQPMLTLHGHIHESAMITGFWFDKIGNTFCFNAAHNGDELSIIKFNLDNIENAERILI
jgi:Icc-related predicted phosphoesterase